MTARPYRVQCLVGSRSGVERNGKVPKGLVTRCKIVVSSSSYTVPISSCQ